MVLSMKNLNKNKNYVSIAFFRYKSLKIIFFCVRMVVDKYFSACGYRKIGSRLSARSKKGGRNGYEKTIS